MAKRRLIDLDKIKPIDFPSTEMDVLDVVRYLNALPTVDAVEVIRCKDCKHYDPECEHCCFWRYCIHPEHFCGEGERKIDG